jgi:subtilisin family serine protease
MIAVDRQATSVEYSQQSALAAIDLAGVTTTGRGAVVAVIDTGVDPFHPLLRHRVAAGGWDFVDEDPWPWETADGADQDADGDVDEAAGHGTFVSGLVLLVAPSAEILPYRVLDDEGHGTTFAICRAVLAAVDAGADVLNMSFGFHLRSRVLDRLLDEAQARGVVLVAGAGNDAVDTLPFPARDHRVLAVAATSSGGELAEFSNFGEGAVLAAPGIDLYSGGANGVFGTWSGTSMAAPLVSGAVALLRARNPRLRPAEVAAALLQSRAPLCGDPAGVGGLLQVGVALALVPADPP